MSGATPRFWRGRCAAHLGNVEQYGAAKVTIFIWFDSEYSLPLIWELPFLASFFCKIEVLYLRNIPRNGLLDVDTRNRSP